MFRTPAEETGGHSSLLRAVAEGTSGCPRSGGGEEISLPGLVLPSSQKGWACPLYRPSPPAPCSAPPAMPSTCKGGSCGQGPLWHLEGSDFTRPDVGELQVSMCRRGHRLLWLASQELPSRLASPPPPLKLFLAAMPPPPPSCTKLPAWGGKKIFFLLVNFGAIR